MILDKIFYIKISVPLNAVKSAKSRRLTPFPVDKFGSKGSKRKKKGEANCLTSLLCGTYKLICSYETQCGRLRQVYIDKGETQDI